MSCPLLELIFVDVEQQYRDMKEAQRRTKNYWSNSISQTTNDQMLKLRGLIYQQMELEKNGNDQLMDDIEGNNE